VAALIAVGVAMRFYRFTGPILDQQMFRQTQTAGTVWLWDRFGFDFFDYRVPMFGGGHWVLELPVYQAIVWALSQPFGGIEPVGRLVSIGCFVAVAVLLYLVTARFIGSRVVGVIAVALFTFLPVTVFYYRSFMIDPLFVATALLAVYAAIRLSEGFGWGWWTVFSAALILSVLGKATILLALGLSVVVLAVRVLLDREVALIKKAALVGSGVVAVVLSVLWTRHGDELNRASGSLAFSDGYDWFFGSTLTDAETFRIVGQRLLDNYQAVGLILIGVGVAAIPGVRTRYRPELVATLLGGFISVAVFANLNRVHDHYQLPYYTTLSMIAALGLCVICRAIARGSATTFRQLAVGGVLGLAALWSLYTWNSYFHFQANSVIIAQQGADLARGTPDRPVVVVGEGASPNEPMAFYEARRIGWRIPTSDPREIARRLRRSPEVGALAWLRDASGVIPPWLQRLAEAEGFSVHYETPRMVIFRRSTAVT
jgi:4-amino-4-deoxy-L-arabinose transferase-like glycosyltransferase